MISSFAKSQVSEAKTRFACCMWIILWSSRKYILKDCFAFLAAISHIVRYESEEAFGIVQEDRMVTINFLKVKMLEAASSKYINIFYYHCWRIVDNIDSGLADLDVPEK